MEQLLTGTQAIAFVVASSKQDIYRDIQRTLVVFRYPTLDKASKGIVVRFLIKITGYSRQQVTRLVKQYRDTGKVERQQRTHQGFKSIYTAEDIRLLAALDERHNTLSGPATKKFCERAYSLFGQTQYQRLAGISVAHLYNLRKSKPYLRQRYPLEKTRPKVVPIPYRGDNVDDMGDNLPRINLGSGRTAKAITAGAEHTCAFWTTTRLNAGGLILSVNSTLAIKLIEVITWARWAINYHA